MTFPAYLAFTDPVTLVRILVANGGANHDTIWSTFAHRGMGYFAGAVDGDDAFPVESFALPPATKTFGKLHGKVVDADTHMTERHDLWTSRAPAKFKDRVPRVERIDGAAQWVVEGDVVLGRAGAGGVVDVNGHKGRSFEGLYEWEIDQGHRAGWDLSARMDLLDEIGVDAARFFLLQRSHDTTVDLDLDLARRQSSDNPVYYVQYAHARIASLRQKAGEARVEAALGALAGGSGSDAALEPAERGVVLGDLAESAPTPLSAFRDLLGLIVRRQVAMWRNWRPWRTTTTCAARCSPARGRRSVRGWTGTSSAASARTASGWWR